MTLLKCRMERFNRSQHADPFPPRIEIRVIPPSNVYYGVTCQNPHQPVRRTSLFILLETFSTSVTECYIEADAAHTGSLLLAEDTDP